MADKKTKVRLDMPSTLPPRTPVSGRRQGDSRRQGEAEGQQRPEQGNSDWVAVFLLAAMVVVGAVVMIKGGEKGKEVPSPLPSLVAEAEAEVSSSVVSAAPVVQNIQLVEQTVGLYLLTGTGEAEAKEAIQQYWLANRYSALEQGSNLLEQLKIIHAPYPEGIFQRYGQLTEWLNPGLGEEILQESARFKNEAEQLVVQEAAKSVPREETIETEAEAEKVEINLAPVNLSGLGIWISPENFQVAYKEIRRIPYESTWKVETVKKTPLLLFVSLYEMTFQREGQGNPQTTWYKGIFVSPLDIKEGDVVSGEWLWKNLWESIFP